MKPISEELEKCRITSGRMASDRSYGNNGAFKIRLKSGFWAVISSSGAGWEHVSITPINKKRCPTWGEMCQLKNMFWSEDETVIQYHPAKEDYVDNHPYCLHLWKPTDQDLPKPPPILVGIGRKV
jgi:hypothetical protein